MTFDEMKAIEPRLAEVERCALDVGVDPTYRTYEFLKGWMRKYVGWEAQDERLATQECYNRALDRLIELVCP